MDGGATDVSILGPMDFKVFKVFKVRQGVLSKAAVKSTEHGLTRK